MRCPKQIVRNFIAAKNYSAENVDLVRYAFSFYQPPTGERRHVAVDTFFVKMHPHWKVDCLFGIAEKKEFTVGIDNLVQFDTAAPRLRAIEQAFVNEVAGQVPWHATLVPHYSPAFDLILETFLAKNSTTMENVSIVYADWIYKLMDRDFAESWKAYHKAHALITLVTHGEKIRLAHEYMRGVYL